MGEYFEEFYVQLYLAGIRLHCNATRISMPSPSLCGTITMSSNITATNPISDIIPSQMCVSIKSGPNECHRMMVVAYWRSKKPLWGLIQQWTASLQPTISPLAHLLVHTVNSTLLHTQWWQLTWVIWKRGECFGNLIKESDAHPI